jgi:protein-S-isoprenylcysteine O-methyltransferase Ste14
VASACVPRLATAALVIAGSLAYLALAAFGAGGITIFLSRPQFVAATIIAVALSTAGAFSQGGIRSGEREDRGNRWVLAAFALIGLLDGYFPAYSDRVGFWTLDGGALRWLGVALFGGGGVLRIWPVFVLGRRFSGLVAIQPGHELVTGGVYGVIRHPSYLGLLVSTLGWAFLFDSGVGILLTVLILVPLLARIASEETLLESQFGARYAAYRTRTWRLLPFIY